jgi:hypothetical protein
MLSQAELRRQLSGERKRTTKLAAAHTKMQSLYEARAVDLKALRTALGNREDQIKVLSMVVDFNRTDLSAHMQCMTTTSVQAASQAQKERDELHATNMDRMAEDLAVMARACFLPLQVS